MANQVNNFNQTNSELEDLNLDEVKRQFHKLGFKMKKGITDSSLIIDDILFIIDDYLENFIFEKNSDGGRLL
ncbi:hypothetical protein OAQ99_02565 [Candidatus Kapabacteria bacterium]|nr:hypothetical protein [Candidatus Kapabacteria bacterium]